MKSILSTRPVWHKCDETIRGHVFASFLSLALLKELLGRMREAGHPTEWKRLKKDLDALGETEVTTKAGQNFFLRSDVKGDCGKALQAAGVAIPARVRQPS